MTEPRRDVMQSVLEGLMVDPGAGRRRMDELTEQEREIVRGLFANLSELKHDEGERLAQLAIVLHELGVPRSPWPPDLTLVPDEARVRLEPLYLAMSEGLRADFDRRWGRPEL